MKAIVCHEFAPLNELKYEDLPDPEVKKNHVVIKNTAIGVNFPDGLLVQGLYQMKPPTPFSPGIEVAGVIESVGENVEVLEAGQKVAALVPYGAYVEKILVHKSMVQPLPAQIPEADACALMCGYGTSHHALKQRANLQPGETLLVLGAAGATGLAAIQIGKAMGANVIAVASTQEKLDIAKENGADELINYSEQDLKTELKTLTKGQGVDVVFDPVGGDAFDAATRSMAWNGRYLVIGFASGKIPELAVNLALVKGFSLIGVFWGTFAQRQPKDYMANQQELLAWYSEGKVKPLISKTYKLAEAANALGDVLGRKVVGKIILEP